MPQFNWEEARKKPLQFCAVLWDTLQQAAVLIIKRTSGHTQHEQALLLDTIKHRLLLAANTRNPNLVLSVPLSTVHCADRRDHGTFNGFVVPAGTVLGGVDVVLLFLHGGGYAIGHPLQYRAAYTRWIKKARNMHIELAVFALRYPLAPAHQCPAQLDAATSAYRQLLDGYNVLPNKVIIAGDSAGANLAASLLLKIRDDDQLPTPAGTVLHSPLLDFTLTNVCESASNLDDVLVSPSYLKDIVAPMLTGGRYAARDPRISPALSTSLKNLPPQMVFYGSTEKLRPDAEAWIARCKADDVDVIVSVGVGGLHCFSMGGLASSWKLQEGSDTEMLRFIKKVIAS